MAWCIYTSGLPYVKGISARDVGCRRRGSGRWAEGKSFLRNRTHAPWGADLAPNILGIRLV